MKPMSKISGLIPDKSGNHNSSGIKQLIENLILLFFCCRKINLRLLNLLTGLLLLPAFITGQTTGDFRTSGDASFISALNWERYNGTAWIAAAAAPVESDGVITIRSGHTASITANINLDQMVVATEGTLTIQSAAQLNLRNGTGIDLDVTGSVNNYGSINPQGGTTISFNAGSTYNHARNGSVIPVAAWASSSTCLITGVTTSAPGNLNQSFGHFSWNCTSQTLNDASLLGMNSRTLAGDFNLLSTGTGSVRLATATSMSFTVQGRLNIAGGILNMSNGAGTGTINLRGNFNMIGGTITETSAGAGAIIFNGTENQLFTKSGGTIANTINVAVSNNAILDMSTHILDGSTGTFNLNEGGTLITANTQGITLAPADLSGSIRNTGARIFSTGASYVYNGSSTQITGTGLPATISNLTVNNSSGLTLTNSVNATNSLTLTQGNINTGANILTLSNGIVGSLNYNSGMIIGRLRRSINTFTGTDYLFPIGIPSDYRPASFSFSSLSAPTDITAEFIETAPSGFVTYDDDVVTLNNTFTEGYWRFFSSGTPTAEYTISLTGNGFSSFDFNEITRVTGRDNSNSTWRAMGSHSKLDGVTVLRQDVENLNTVYFDFAFATGCASASIGYAYERSIAIDYTKVEGGEDLFNFPMLVSIAGENYLRSYPAGRIINGNGYDIVFTDEDYNKLDHQIEYYDGTSGDYIAWVRIPLLSSTENTIIRVLYGNPKITADPSVTAVWDSDYKGVWHLDNNGLADFTSYNRPGTSYNSPSFPVGPVYNSIGLNGGNQYAQVISAPNLNIAGNLTVSAWIYLNAGGLDQKIAGNQNGILGGYKFGVYTNNRVEFEIRNSSNTPSLNREVPGGTPLTTGQWYYVAGVSSDVIDSIKTYVNGIPERPFRKTGTLVPSSNNLTIGREPWTGSYFFNGRIDELRVSSRVRSDGWLRTEYNNQSDPSSFFSVEGAEIPAGSLPSGSMCNSPATLNYGFPSGGTYSGNPYIAGNVFTPPAPGTYTLTYTHTGACGTTTDTKNITITAIPSSPVAEDKEYCVGTITYLEATTGVNHRWYSGGTPVSNANPFSTGQTAPGTYNYSVTQTINGCESPPAAVMLSIFAATTITSQPSDLISCIDNNAGFGIKVTGPNLKYQWRKGAVNLTDGANISGATTDSLVLSNLQASDAGIYSCVVSSSCGTPVTSNDATLTVEPLPTPVISGNNVVCPYTGGVVYSVTDVPGHAYNWLVTGGTISGPATGSSIMADWDVPGTGTVTVTEYVSAGCSVTTPDFIVQITDTDVPVIVNCPSDITVSNTPGSCSAVVTWTEPEATDNCTLPVNLIWTRSHLPGSTFNAGTTTVTYAVQDESGNVSAPCTFTVTVIDDEPPSIVAPPPLIVNTDPGTCSAGSVSLGTPVTSDNCLVDEVTNNAPVSFPAGATNVTWTVTDAAGNSANATQTVTVMDNENPAALCRPYTAYLDATGNVNISAADIDNGSSDNCSISSMFVSPDSFDSSHIGPNVVTLTVIDGSGNSNTCQAIVTVIDDLPPQAVCQDITVQLDGSGTVTITAADVDGGSTDNNAIASMTVTPDTFTCSDTGPNTVTLTVTDPGGNSSTCSATVTVVDVISPTVQCKDLTLFLGTDGNGTLSPEDIDNGSTDNCPAGLILSASRTSFSCSDIGTPVTVNLTGTDAVGNSSSCSSLVTVLDTISPVVKVKTFNLMLGATGTGTLLPADVDDGTTDNCGPVTLSVTPDIFNCSDLGVRNVILTAVDVSGNSSSRSVNITVSSSIEITGMALNSCDTSVPGAIFSADIAGGDGSYSYYWDGLEDAFSPFLIASPLYPYLQYSNTSTAERPFYNNLLPGGIYNIRLIVTDGNGCADTSQMIINTGEVTFSNVTIRNSVACEGETKSYSVDLYPGATYNWGVENGTILTAEPYSNNVDIQWDTGTNEGVVIATVSKMNIAGNTCIHYVIDTVAINAIPAPSFINPVTEVCSGSVVTYTLSGIYSSYLWSVTGGTVTGGGGSGTNFVTVLWGSDPVGTLSVSVTTASSCTGSVTLNVSIYDLAGAIISLQHVSCNGGNDGTVTAEAVTGTGFAPYEYSLDGGTYQTDGSFSGIASGDHTVTIRDGLLCTVILPFTVSQPPVLAALISDQVDVACNGGTDGAVTITASGGVAPYEFSLDGGAFQTSGTFAGLASGSYTVTARDGNACERNIPVTIAQPSAPLQGTTAITNVSCFGGSNGSVNLTVSGGTGPYSYLWSTGAVTEDLSALAAGDFSVTITDANSCAETITVSVTEPATLLSGSITAQTNVSVYGGNDGAVTITGTGGQPPYLYRLNSGIFQASGIFTSLTAGTYAVTIQDNNLCTFVITVIITQPSLDLSITLLESVNILCNGMNTGSLTVSGLGGTAPYEYSINGGPYQPSGTFGSLIAGSYVVTVRDAAAGTATLSATLTQPPLLFVTLSKTDNLCVGGAAGTATALANGGTGPYTYIWSTVPVQTTPVATGLPAGSYTVLITDASGCSAATGVIIGQPSIALEVTVTGTDVLCPGGHSGTAAAVVTGGTPPYYYSWNTSPVQTTPEISGLSAGNYVVTVTDGNGCTVDAVLQIAEPQIIHIDASVVPASCPDEPDGSISLSVTGGIQPYNMIWSDGVLTQNRTNIPPGTYSVVVSDANSCAGSLTVEVGFAGTFNCVVIPQIITPNNDGFNDEWIIRNIDLYPDAEVRVFNRWGKMVFRTKNISANPWDGRSDGKLVPTDSYHYILYLNDGSSPRSGVISVIR